MPEIDSLTSKICDLLSKMEPLARVSRINAIRTKIHEVCPMKHHPVDLVLWVPANLVEANAYNPNTVAPPEMRLLELSITADGYTQPVVTWADDGRRETIDGFHRGEVGRTCPAVMESTLGLLPVTTIGSGRTDLSDRMASTIRHNRARGQHQVSQMSEIVRDLAKRNWSDKKIAKHLGMEPDEVLRLKQITGLAELFVDKDFSEAWEISNTGARAAQAVAREGLTGDEAAAREEHVAEYLAHVDAGFSRADAAADVAAALESGE